MKFYKVMKYDYQQHIWKNKRFFIIPLLIFLYCMTIKANLFNIGSGETVTFGDYFFSCFLGCEPISATKETAIPIFWLAGIILSLFLSNGFVQKDLKGFGLQIFIRTKNKSRWWFSKCVTCALISIHYYAFMLLSIFFFCVINRVNCSIKLTEHIAEVLLSGEYFIKHQNLQFNTAQQLFAMYAMPLVVIVCLNFVQMTVSLFVKPIISFMLINVYVLIAVYISTPFSLAEYAMLGHSKMYMVNGLNIVIGFCAGMGIAILMITIGKIFFKNKDIL